MRIIKFQNFLYVLCCVLVLQSPFVLALPLQASIKLDKIEAIKQSEKSGDELYIDITQYSSVGQSKTSRIPEKPAYWIASLLPKVKDVVLWQGMVQDNEELKIIFSLVELDPTIWDVDDLIGSVQVILTHKNGKLEHEWSVPIFEEKVEVQMNNSNKPKSSQEFRMKGDHSEYRVSLHIEKP